MTRRWFYLCLCLLLAVAGSSGAERPALEFIQLTDTHLVDLTGAEARVAEARKHFAPSARSLPAFFAGPGRKQHPSFYLITGDLIDAFRYETNSGLPVIDQVERFARVAAGAGFPVYLTLGNHDIQHYSVSPATGKLVGDQSVAGEARAAWIAQVKCFAKGTYYSFEKTVGRTTYRFLILDNGYGAGVAAEQLAWLRGQAKIQGDRPLILAMHIPLGEDAKSAAIKEALGGARIALILAGHKHSNAVEEIAAGAGTAVQVRTAAFGYGENNWRRIRLREDAIEVFATGANEQLEKAIAVLAPAAAAR